MEKFYDLLYWLSLAITIILGSLTIHSICLLISDEEAFDGYSGWISDEDVRSMISYWSLRFVIGVVLTIIFYKLQI